MRKLNIKKIKWIMKEVERREMGVWTIAKQQKITPRWARELSRKYKGKEIRLKKPGRKVKPIPVDERKLVIDTYNEYLVCAAMIERILDDKGKHIGHNKIHKILLGAKLAKHEDKKQKTRKYKCYQRKHSLSLVHMDWFQFRGKWYILYEDDASRFVTGSGEFPNRSSNNAWKVFKKSLMLGVPKQLHSDNDSTFKANEREGRKKGECDFERKVREAGVHQIFARPAHPQSNGKNEKLNGTIKRLMKKGKSFKEAVEHYNFKKPHWALDTTEGKLRTPYRAFLDKTRK